MQIVPINLKNSKQVQKTKQPVFGNISNPLMTPMFVNHLIEAGKSKPETLERSEKFFEKSVAGNDEIVIDLSKIFQKIRHYKFLHKSLDELSAANATEQLIVEAKAKKISKELFYSSVDTGKNRKHIYISTPNYDIFDNTYNGILTRTIKNPKTNLILREIQYYENGKIATIVNSTKKGNFKSKKIFNESGVLVDSW